jgi:predicted ferric reductase
MPHWAIQLTLWGIVVFVGQAFLPVFAFDSTRLSLDLKIFQISFSISHLSLILLLTIPTQ